MEIYHGSQEIVQYPLIRKTKFTKDFSWGFYCTNNYTQAKRWAERHGSNGVVNVYEYTPNDRLNILRFERMTDEWLDFIAFCRAGNINEYDIVEGPMADDQVWDYVTDYLKGKINFPLEIICYIVPNLIVGHWAFDDIVLINIACPAESNEIQPFISHSLKTKYVKPVVWSIFIYIHDTITAVPFSPSLCLRIVVRAIKSPRKILGKFCFSYKRILNDLLTSMINFHSIIS